MEESAHYHTDSRGHRYQILVRAEDLVVFDSNPPLGADGKVHGWWLTRHLRRNISLLYEIREDRLYWLDPSAPDGTESEWIPAEYSGVLTVGKDFDYRFWQHDEKARPVPFCPEVYKQNGYLKLENGRVVERVIQLREA